MYANLREGPPGVVVHGALCAASLWRSGGNPHEVVTLYSCPRLCMAGVLIVFIGVAQHRHPQRAVLVVPVHSRGSFLM